MQLQSNTTSPKVYIGLDVHKKTWSVSIQTDLFFHKTYSMPSKAVDLYDYVAKHFPDYEVSLVYVAGGCGFHATRHFLNFNFENILSVSMIIYFIEFVTK
jgi:transposase